MKYIVCEADYDGFELLQYCDTKEEAEAIVEKLGYGEIRTVDSSFVDINEDLHYVGSYYSGDLRDFHPKTLHLIGRPVSEENDENLVAYKRYGDNLHFHIGFIKSKSRKEVIAIVTPLIQAIIEDERTKPKPVRVFKKSSSSVSG